MALVARHGELLSRRRIWLAGSALILPGLLWLLLLIALPMLGMVALSMLGTDDYGTVQARLTAEHFKRLGGWDSVLQEWNWDPLRILVRSGILAGITTALCLLLALPMSLAIAAAPERMRLLLLALIIVPTCVNLVIRTYAWQLMLCDASPVAWSLAGLGTSLHHALSSADPPQWASLLSGILGPNGELYPGPFAVYLGMVSCMLPFTILPLYQSVERIDWSVVEAVEDCYGSRWAVLRHGIISQITPGLVAALILTLVPSLGMFVVSDMLSGAKFMLIGNFIQQQFLLNNWPGGAAAGLLLVLLSLAALLVISRWGGGLYASGSRS